MTHFIRDNVECHHAECRISILSMLHVIMLSVIMLIVVILSVVAPLKEEIRKLRVEDTYLIGSLNHFAMTSDNNPSPRPSPRPSPSPIPRPSPSPALAPIPAHSLHQGILTEREGSLQLNSSLG